MTCPEPAVLFGGSNDKAQGVCQVRLTQRLRHVFTVVILHRWDGEEGLTCQHQRKHRLRGLWAIAVQDLQGAWSLNCTEAGSL